MLPRSGLSIVNKSAVNILLYSCNSWFGWYWFCDVRLGGIISGLLFSFVFFW